MSWGDLRARLHAALVRFDQQTTAWRLGAVAIGLAIALPVLVAWQRRWVSDDGLIYSRAVRQILAGNGPTFNVHERVETSTGTLWQWLVAAGTGLTGGSRPDLVAVYLGLLCGAAALVVAVRAAARLMPGPAPLVPVGIWLVALTPPFWDFMTSGLETALAFLWLALSWSLLTCLLESTDRRLPWLAAVWIGAGVLIRPDLAVATLVFLPVLLWLTWHGTGRPRLRALGLVAAGGAAPVAYEIFRMGYYGEVVPLPAITKSAGGAEWAEGFAYLADFVGASGLVIPLLLVLGYGVVRVVREPDRRTRIVLAAPLVVAVLLALYVIRVGGDFMYARMLLPSTLLIALPVFVVRARTTQAAVARAVFLTGAASMVLGIALPHLASSNGFVVNERAYYSDAVASNPMAPDYVRYFTATVRPEPSYNGLVTASRLPEDVDFPLDPRFRFDSAATEAWLGTLGAGLALSDGAIDPLGLAYPLVAHMEAEPGGRPGHAKELPLAWLLADYADPDAPLPEGVDPADVAAARHALTCGGLADLVAASREPMSVSRFFDNLTSAVGRARLVVPTDPQQAEQKFCG